MKMTAYSFNGMHAEIVVNPQELPINEETVPDMKRRLKSGIETSMASAGNNTGHSNGHYRPQSISAALCNQ
jgi:hypothetical protein